ncbi:MAG TPA: TonB family protein [Gammaproteobacteria bacterium]|nr:TonB family protein [Gammaproteobacteria bacterium]
MSDERLGSTLFLAALVHGVVILGVTFTAATTSDDTAPSLNVTLVLDTGREELAADTAEFISNRNQQGAGVAARGLRPTSSLSADQPASQLGDPLGADASDGTPREARPSAEQLASQGNVGDPVPALPQPIEAPAPTLQRAAALIEQAPQTTALEVGLRAELPNGNDDARTLIATPSTRESGLAEYLDGWRRRVERIGTANYPNELLGNIHAGRPTLEVVIAADGRLDDIVVRRSSGDKALDQAALKILRLAAPFPPLPPSIREDYDVLRFAYEWDFAAGGESGR